jgi:hypothetical protein
MENWTQLPAWFRYLISLGLVAVGVALFLFANPVPLGLIGTLVGVGLVLMFLGPSEGDDNGYKF